MATPENKGLERVVHLRTLLGEKKQDLERLFYEHYQHTHKLFAERDAGNITLEDVERHAEEDRQRHLKERDEKLAEMDQIINELLIIQTEAGIEGTKLKVEALKQQGTFAAAAVAGVTAIVASDLIPEGASHVYLVWITLAILLVTIVISLFLIYIESSNVEYVLKTGVEPNKYHKIKANLTRLLYVSVLGLPAAIVVFMVFVVLDVLR